MSKLDIVVAHAYEDLNWLEEMKNFTDTRVIVYSKAPANALPILPDVPFMTLSRLANVGREAHTYLHHIIKNYDSLADNILFTQGNPFEHRSHDNFFDNYVKNKNNTSICPLAYMSSIPQSWKPRLKDIEVSSGNIGTWWEAVFSEPYPKKLKVIWNAIFRIKREHVHNRPRAFYMNAIKTLRHHVNPEEGHYFERAWGNIFGL